MLENILNILKIFLMEFIEPGVVNIFGGPETKNRLKL